MKYKHTTIKDFNALKALQEVGMDQRAAGEAIGKSYDTARRVYKSKSWEDYRENLSDINEKYGKKKTPRVTEENPTVVESPTPSIPANLSVILIGLTTSIDELTKVIKSKRRIF